MSDYQPHQVRKHTPRSVTRRWRTPAASGPRRLACASTSWRRPSPSTSARARSRRGPASRPARRRCPLRSRRDSLRNIARSSAVPVRFRRRVAERPLGSLENMSRMAPCSVAPRDRPTPPRLRRNGADPRLRGHRRRVLGSAGGRPRRDEPRNAALLARRDEIQDKIDAYLIANRGGHDQADYLAFLREIGYLEDAPSDVAVATSNVDNEIAGTAGPSSSFHSTTPATP